ncbi:hypothetical protein TWF481_006562 [Arthrobotrys musiformis]|uniref:Subtilisin-like serine protease protein n=1 Tax=Arthrobotrys musiformis TaxID=47236 RepID=A0AAV9W8W4_9PEZI
MSAIPEPPYSLDTAKRILSQTFPGKAPNFPTPAIFHSQSVEDYINSELDFSRFRKTSSSLFWAGLPGNISPLNKHVALRRQIIAAEQTDLHLVWGGGVVYIKPLPPFLLNHSFFAKTIIPPRAGVDRVCNPRIIPSEVYNAARWMLLSYAKLIRHPSDLLIARQSGLLAGVEIEEEITWPNWVAFASEILENVCFEEFEGRFWYGDLRLDRLNIIFRFRLGLLRGFFLNYERYGSFFSTNFKWVAISFLYVSVVLSAMQVGLAGVEVEQSEDTKRDMAVVSFWFAVFCMALVIFVLVLLALTFLGLFVWNYWKTRHFEGGMRVKQMKYRS